MPIFSHFQMTLSRALKNATSQLKESSFSNKEVKAKIKNCTKTWVYTP